MDNITNLLNLQGVKTNYLKSEEKYFYLEATTEPSEQTCPCCGNKTKFIHGYRTQKIKDLTIKT